MSSQAQEHHLHNAGFQCCGLCCNSMTSAKGRTAATQATCYFWIIAFNASLLLNLTKLVRIYHFALASLYW